jgi:hypothetical protein
MIVKTTTTKPTRIDAPAFTGATAIFRAGDKLDKASKEYNKALSNIYGEHITACHKAGIPKSKAGAKAVHNAIKTGFAEAYRAKLIREGTAEAVEYTTAVLWSELCTTNVGLASYTTSAVKAFVKGIEWQAGLFNTVEFPDHCPVTGEKWSKSKAAKERAAKAGKVESTDRAALDATLSKALKQARMLGLGGFAADMEALCADCLDGFKVADAE